MAKRKLEWKRENTDLNNILADVGKNNFDVMMGTIDKYIANVANSHVRDIRDLEHCCGNSNLPALKEVVGKAVSLKNVEVADEHKRAEKKAREKEQIERDLKVAKESAEKASLKAAKELVGLFGVPDGKKEAAVKAVLSGGDLGPYIEPKISISFDGSLYNDLDALEKHLKKGGKLKISFLMGIGNTALKKEVELNLPKAYSAAGGSDPDYSDTNEDLSSSIVKQRYYSRGKWIEQELMLVTVKTGKKISIAAARGIIEAGVLKGTDFALVDTYNEYGAMGTLPVKGGYTFNHKNPTKVGKPR